MKEISRLRRKFIIYNMLIVTAVIGITFAALVFVLKGRGNEESRLILERALEQADQTLLPDAPPQARLPYFSILVTEKGDVVMREGGYNFLPGAYDLERLALLGMAAEADDGMLDGYPFRYLRVEQPSGHLLAFADTSYGDSVRSGLILYGGLACAAIWIVFFGLSFLFSRLAVRPLVRSLQLQKQFVADASHELKTPLTVITANAGLLRERCAGLSPETDRWMDNIGQECRDMRALVENLLLLAKEDAQTKREQIRGRVSFSDLVTEKLLVFEPLFFQEGKALSYEVADGIFVKGDASQLGQLIQVLLDNAVKYAVCRPDGPDSGAACGHGARARVRLERVGRRWVRLRVDSEGEAIPKEKRTLIFRRFYRGENERASRTGYGLGLAIAEGIVRRHGGRMGVEYHDGMNCFYVSLRACREE